MVDVPLKVAYSDLYIMDRYQNISVVDCWDGDDWFIDFRRSLSQTEFNSWSDLLHNLTTISLEEGSRDIVFGL